MGICQIFVGTSWGKCWECSQHLLCLHTTKCWEWTQQMLCVDTTLTAGKLVFMRVLESLRREIRRQKCPHRKLTIYPCFARCSTALKIPSPKALPSSIRQGIRASQAKIYLASLPFLISFRNQKGCFFTIYLIFLDNSKVVNLLAN